MLSNFWAIGARTEKQWGITLNNVQMYCDHIVLAHLNIPVYLGLPELVF